jgi:ABC-type multidrug transport system fused ATPase/permease subunit
MLIPEKLKVLWRFIYPYRKQLGFLSFLSILIALLDGIMLVLLFDFIRLIINQSLEISRFVTWVLVPLGLSNFKFQTIAVIYAACLGILALTRFGGNALFERNINQLRGYVLTKIQENLMRLYLYAPWYYFWNKKHGEMLFHITGAPLKATEVFLQLSKIVATSIMLVVIPVVLFFMSASLFLVGVILGIGYFLLIHKLGRRVSYYTGKGRVDSSRIQNALAAEALSGIRYIRAYGYEKTWLNLFSVQVRRFADLMARDAFWTALPPRLIELFVVLGFLTLILASMVIISGKFTESIPVLGTYFFGIIRLLPSLSQMGSARMQLQGNLPYIEALEKITHEIDLKTACSGQPVPISSSKGGIEISLESIGFSYEPERPVLNEFTLNISPAKITALVGASGSGKSTVLDLILGFIQPHKGQVLINGKPLTSLDINDLRSRIALVGQDVFLFHDTIEANLRMGFPEAPFEKVEEAAAIAGILEVIQSLPDKWQTVIGDRGIKLSGGQRQRFALARALLRNPDIYLLDEPTSALDAETEQAIMPSFLEYVRKKTVVLVAHRLQTIQHADMIVIIDKGRIVGSGSHEELMNQKGLYTAMVRAAGLSNSNG